MSTIKIIQTNIAELQVDYVVNAANENLHAGSGVCGSIFAAAGSEQLQEACSQIGGCEVGHAVVTPGFNLSAKYIIHAVGPHWYGGNQGEDKQLYSCYQASMDIVKVNGGHSVAFPVISSGVFEYPKERAWKIGIRAVRDFLKSNDFCDIDVIFAVTSEKSKEIGNAILAGEEQPANQHMKHFRLYTIEGTEDISNGKAEFVAEFADRKFAQNYIKYMLGKKRFAGKGIAIEEVIFKETINEYRVMSVIAPSGEELKFPMMD